MGSKAYTAFIANHEDVDHLVGTYDGALGLFEEFKQPAPPGLEVVFPSATVLMVSHWEAYVEDIVTEALEHIVTHIVKAEDLPKEIKKAVAAELKADAHELAMWKLADDGWRDFLKSRLASMRSARNKLFNTPKSAQTAEFMKKGIGLEDIGDAWKFDGLTELDVAKKLDGLIEVRGQIAHRGRLGVKVDKDWVVDHAQFIAKLASKTGGRVNRHVRDVTGKPLW